MVFITLKINKTYIHIKSISKIKRQTKIKIFYTYEFLEQRGLTNEQPENMNNAIEKWAKDINM